MKKINSLEQKILDSLEAGENTVTSAEIACKLGISRQTICKYLHVLQVKGYLTKKTIPVSGGTTNDPRVTSLITKL